MPRCHCFLTAETDCNLCPTQPSALLHRGGVSSTNSPLLTLEEEESVEHRREPAETAEELRAQQGKALVSACKDLKLVTS